MIQAAKFLSIHERNKSRCYKNIIIFNVFIISHANDLKRNHHQMKPGDWKYMLTEVSSGV